MRLELRIVLNEKEPDLVFGGVCFGDSHYEAFAARSKEDLAIGIKQYYHANFDVPFRVISKNRASYAAGWDPEWIKNWGFNQTDEKVLYLGSLPSRDLRQL